jgi:hypothetical protein
MKKRNTFAIIASFLILSGCAVSRGNLENPVLIPSTQSLATDNKKATVKFYRSSDHFGLLQFSDYTVFTDYEIGKYEDGFNVDEMMLANRTKYTIKTFTPRIYSFSFMNLLNRGIFKQTANLEEGKIYYLAVSFHLGGIAGLEFRTKDEFDRDTEGDIQIEFTGECTYWKGCDYHEVGS